MRSVGSKSKVMWRKAKILGPQKDLEPFPLGGQQRLECALVSGGGIGLSQCSTAGTAFALALRSRWPISK